MATKTVTFGDELRRWRSQRRMSQLDLAVAAEVSQRHLSFLETGRSKPSPEMVIHLGRALDLALRDQNLLLGAAGFAPAYPERGLDDPELDQVIEVLQNLVDAHGHFPAYVLDRGWNVVLANQAAFTVIDLITPAPPPEVAANILRLTLHPLGLRSLISNWEEVALTLLHRVEREVAHSPHDDELRALLEEVLAYPGVADLTKGRSPFPDGADLVVPLRVSRDGTDMAFFTTIATIGAPFDITLAELRLETLLPADATTGTFLRTLSG